MSDESNGTPIRKALARPATAADLGTAWWNSMTERQRLESLRAADSSVPADAWEWWKRTAAGCEEACHE
jgi:hypothetical protein